MPALTKKGARSVTADLDKLAQVFQDQFETLGVPAKIAKDFAYRCDLLSDHVERHALRLAGEEPEEKEEEKDESKKEAGEVPEAFKKNWDKGDKKDDDKKDDKGEDKTAAAKKAEDETGTSVEPQPGNQGFDANDIGDQKPGPLEIIQPPSEPWMNGTFMQNWFQELRDLQEAGTLQSNAAKGAILTKAASEAAARLGRLRRLANVSQLSVLQDVLKALQARLESSSLSEVKSLASEVGKQVVSVGKVRDLQIEQQVAGPADPLLLLAADRIVQVLSEEIPALKGVAVAVDEDSPMAVLEAQKSVGSLKELVSLSSAMIADAVKSASKGGESKKEASVATAVKAGEDVKPEKDEKKDDDKTEKTASDDSYNLAAV